jgi:Zn-dependent hydrolases, including glyoxylases
VSGSGVRHAYLLDYGLMQAEWGWFLPDAATYSQKDKPRKWVEFPMSGALIEHEDGWIMIDSGPSPEAAKVWPRESFEAFPVVKFSEENVSVNQLKLLGLKPEDIRAIIFTHLHLDHVGQAYLFRDSSFLIAHRRELEHALVQMWEGKYGAYVPADFEPLKGARWVLVDEERLEVLPGVEVIHTGGHTPGHMVVRVEAPNGDVWYFMGDFFHMPEEFQAESKGWLLFNGEQFESFTRKMKFWTSSRRVHMFITHDPTNWQKYPKIPKPLF